MSYPMDINLVTPNVVTDHTFRSTGIYTGFSGGVNYAVIDPRKHNINVWSKRRIGGVADPWDWGWYKYRMTAKRLGSHYFTNGPWMDAGSSNKIIRILSLLFRNWRWDPVGRVISNSSILHRGTNSTIGHYFGRNGQGSFTNYIIAPGVPSGVEAIGGLAHAISAGSVVAQGPIVGVTNSIGICCLGLRPIPPISTTGDEWGSEDQYIDPESESNDILDGVIVIAGTDVPTVVASVPTLMLYVGVTEAVAVDGSDSVLMGAGSNIFADCSWPKDRIQRWGFYCQ